MSVLLNAPNLPTTLPPLLASDDRSLRRSAQRAGLILYRYAGDEAKHELAYRDYADFFYGITRVERAGDFRVVVHHSRPAFVEAFVDGYQPSGYAPEHLGLSDADVADRDVTLAANYLVKNFWHNLVHVLRQEIDDNNFRNFRGVAREQSDFTADNLGAIALLLSYAHNVTADSLRKENEPDLSIVHLIRRNRCSRMFGVRAERSGEEIDGIERDWRYRRSVAVYVSAWLLASGRAVASISVHCGRRMEELARRVVVELNGIYFSTDYEECAPPSRSDSEAVRQAFRTHLRLLAGQVDSAYRRWLAALPSRRDHARSMLASELKLLGLARSPESLQSGS